LRPVPPPFFVLSIKAGGTGLNLTAASQVIHFDRWWNPAVENQATDRAFRIGQQRNVLVHKFVTSGTLEEKIDQMLSEKQHTADQILTGGAEKSLTEMSNDELLNMIQLDIEKAEINL
jgi:non-specific serine/threonine protein kinase